ncbi:hypothetical protein BpHYR1_008709 [Brachionus plicatilis]|uniref:Uncharacterized protein n=1 Tax=Brachionus plicatilis TaxID=10195 RepID=A0A3M7TAX3_BRAPC|nr:hypothetical protein BpHYR1_008709 [Brachionus plicatilis]
MCTGLFDLEEGRTRLVSRLGPRPLRARCDESLDRDLDLELAALERLLDLERLPSVWFRLLLVTAAASADTKFV